MKKCFLLSIVTFCFLISSFSQGTEVKDVVATKDVESIAKAQKDSLKWAHLESLAYFPLIKAGTFSGVLPVEGVDEIPDPKRDYKLLFEFTLFNKDSTHEKLNPGLVEIARILNLHVASGIPLSHIHPVIVVHGGSLFSIENNGVYQAKYKKDNPNSKLIQDLMKNGAKFIACGQALDMFDINKKELYPGVKLSLTAQTVLSDYIGQSYVLYGIHEEK